MAIIDKDIDKEPKWYSLRVFVGYENVAKENLETMTVKYGLQDRIFKIEIPMENVELNFPVSFSTQLAIKFFPLL